jgi:hypothetical protein
MAARVGTVVAMIPAWRQDQRAGRDQILEVVGRCGDQRASGLVFCRRLAGLLASEDPASVPAFAALGEAEAGLAVFVHGEMDVAVTRSGGEEIVSGRDVATWVDRIVDEPIDSISVTPGGHALPEVDEALDLRTGVVPAGSLLLTKREGAPKRPADVAQPAEREKAVPDHTTLDSGGDLEEIKAGVFASESQVSAQAAEEQTSSFRTIALRGVSLDEPRQPLPIGGEPPAAEPAIPPPLGLLLFDDGTTFSVDGEVVLGREPLGDSRVASGDAQPLVVNDTDRSVSRLHLRIAPRGDEVELVDLKSANGTAVRPPRESAWHQLTPGVPMTISPETEVRLGNRSFMFTAQDPSRRR